VLLPKLCGNRGYMSVLSHRVTVLPMYTHVTATAGCVVMLMMYVVSWRNLTVVSAPANLMPACKHQTSLMGMYMPCGQSIMAPSSLVSECA
jgi:hypothetical protein